MIEQLQREIQSYELACIQHSIHALRDELQDIEAAKLPSVIQRTLDVLEEMTYILQPALGSYRERAIGRRDVMPSDLDGRVAHPAKAKRAGLSGKAESRYNDQR